MSEPLWFYYGQHPILLWWGKMPCVWCRLPWDHQPWCRYNQSTSAVVKP